MIFTRNVFWIQESFHMRGTHMYKAKWKKVQVPPCLIIFWRLPPFDNGLSKMKAAGNSQFQKCIIYNSKAIMEWKGQRKNLSPSGLYFSPEYPRISKGNMWNSLRVENTIRMHIYQRLKIKIPPFRHLEKASRARWISGSFPRTWYKIFLDLRAEFLYSSFPALSSGAIALNLKLCLGGVHTLS